MSVQDMLAKKKALVPASGFVVVGIEEYGDVDEQGPYWIGAFDKVEDAKKELSKQRSESPDETFYIYSADGSVVESDDTAS